MHYSENYKRILAFIIDAIIVGIVHYILVSIFGFNAFNFPIWTLPNGMHLNVSLLSTFIFIVYFTLFDSSKLKGSPGKKILKLSILNDDFTKINIYKAFLRSMLKSFSFSILFIGFIPAFFSDDKKSLHDKLTGTIVVND
jgi:uncharacterized RDD family membrane protein YckC